MRQRSATPKTPQLSIAQQDMAALHLGSDVDEEELARERAKYEEKFVPTMKHEEIIAKVVKQEAESGKKNISLVVVGECGIKHLDLSFLHQATSTLASRRSWDGCCSISAS